MIRKRVLLFLIFAFLALFWVSVFEVPIVSATEKTTPEKRAGHPE